MSSFFFEYDRGFDQVKQYLVAIFTTKGCFWAQNGKGCYMCGYSADSDPNITLEEWKKQLEIFEKKIQGVEGLKLYNSGSFFDRREVPQEIFDKLCNIIKNSSVNEVVVESCSHLVNDANIKEFKEKIGNKYFEIALGLESSHNGVLEYSINKPTRFNQFISAAEIIKRNSGHVKAYLLFKPPFLTEYEAYLDTLHSAKDIIPYADTISINLCNVQKHSMLNWLYSKKEYRPGWLWTVIEILNKISAKDYRILLGLAGGGSLRGAHNCKKCKKNTLFALKQFVETQDHEYLKEPDCQCKELWRVENGF